MRKPHRKLVLSVVMTAAFLLPFLVPANGQQANPNIAGTIKAFKAATVIDQSMVRNGNAPPVILKYDAQILALLNESADIWAKQDKGRAREFVSRLNALRAAKDAAQKPYLAAARARAEEATRRANAARSAADAERCTDIRGQNICGPTPSPGSRSTGPHPCPAGPGPGEVQVGTDGGGQPFCQ